MGPLTRETPREVTRERVRQGEAAATALAAVGAEVGPLDESALRTRVTFGGHVPALGGLQIERTRFVTIGASPAQPVLEWEIVGTTATGARYTVRVEPVAGRVIGLVRQDGGQE